MPAAPPAADTKKPATPPPPGKADQERDKTKDGGTSKKPGEAGKDEKKKLAPPPGQDKAKEAPASAGDKAGATDNQKRFDRMAVRAKLAVSEPGDAIEREADAIADKVMRAPATGATSGS